MRKVGVVGATGRTGRYVVQALAERSDAELCAAVVSPNSPSLGQHVEGSHVVYTSELESLAGADVVIEFSNPETSVRVAEWCAWRGVPVLAASTGHSAEQLKTLQGLGAAIAIAIISNTSVGAAVLTALVGQAQQLLGPTFDVEVLDIHHRGKKDAPSGTARTLVHSIASESQVVFGRQEQRQVGEVGVVSLRGGDVVGDHTVYFLGNGERIEIVHRVSTRAVFGQGAVDLAVRLCGLPRGVYSVDQLIAAVVK